MVRLKTKRPPFFYVRDFFLVMVMVMTACARTCFLLYKVRPSETNWFQLLPAICGLKIFSHLIKGWTMNKQGRWWQTIIPQSDIPCRNNQELLWDINNKIPFTNFHFVCIAFHDYPWPLSHTKPLWGCTLITNIVVFHSE